MWNKSYPRIFSQAEDLLEKHNIRQIDMPLDHSYHMDTLYLLNAAVSSSEAPECKLYSASKINCVK